MWDADIMLPWLQPWVHKNDGGLINYSPGCRAYTRAKDSAAAQPADSESSNSSGAICLDARLSCLQSICKLILPKGFWKMPFTLALAKCAPDKTQLQHSSSWSHILLCFSTCSEGYWEPFPTAEKLLENRLTLKHFPIMFIRLDIVNYDSPTCSVLHQPQCLILLHLHCNPRDPLVPGVPQTYILQMENEPLFTAGFVLPSASWTPGLERQVNMGSSSLFLPSAAVQPRLPYLMLFWAHCKAMFGPHPFEAPGEPEAIFQG